MRLTVATFIIVAAGALVSCTKSEAPASAQKTSPMTANITDFGKTPSGQPVSLYTLKNKNGIEVAITTYGGILVSLKTPDRNGQLDDIVLGFDSLDGYLGAHPYFGAIVGRYANRIGGAAFKLDGVQYKLAVNNGPNSLHGGLKGFDKYVWEVKDAGPQSLTLTHTSPDGDEGYPGTLKVEVTYTLTDDNELKLDYTATTDKATVLNVSNHSYFNLAGQGNGDILNHTLELKASRITPVDKTLIPTGDLKPVAGTPFDFTTPHKIGERINAKDQQIEFGGGYDHNFVADGDAGTLRLIARASEETSGRVMEVFSTQPGVQFYTGNFLDGTLKGKGGKVYQKRFGFCLETQHYPDSPNKPKFPTTVLKPGETFHHTTVLRFTR